MFEQLLKDLNSRKLAVRGDAMRKARALPPEQLLELMELETKKYRSRKRASQAAYWILELLICIAVLIDWGLHGKFQTLWFVFLFMNLWTVLFVPKRAHRNVALLVERVEDARFIGPALSMLQNTDGTEDTDVRWKVIQILKRLLPKLAIDQANTLTLEQRRALLIPLRLPYDDTELTLSILKTLEQVGDEKAITIVEKLAGGGVVTPKMRRVQQAAQDCLPYLKIRMERLQQAQTLLRASDASTAVVPEVLLRPVTANVTETPPEQLLRAARSES